VADEVDNLEVLLDELEINFEVLVAEVEEAIVIIEISGLNGNLELISVELLLNTRGKSSLSVGGSNDVVVRDASRGNSVDPDERRNVNRTFLELRGGKNKGREGAGLEKAIGKEKIPIRHLEGGEMKEIIRKCGNMIQSIG
jgi:hypothetical protein